GYFLFFWGQMLSSYKYDNKDDLDHIKIIVKRVHILMCRYYKKITANNKSFNQLLAYSSMTT
ncbi:MAG TPA: hypothetical protein DHV27_05910, partial [Psychrobacter sp.]|nr:hypothetical protein [Psychrobacter sp.]